jgi:hypothetical protein
LLIINNQQKGKKKQNGLALLVLVVVIFLAISTYYFSSVSTLEIQVDKIEKTQAVLKRAKQALLDYALVKYLTGEAGKIGKLPCPDYKSSGVDVDGEQDGSCGNAYANAIGYFPWRTLGIDITKDSSGSCLLYAVSPAYKTSPEAALNPDSFGQFRTVDNVGMTLQGVLPEDRPVAVIIAPESPLPGQARENNPPAVCGSYYSNDISTLIAAYLDNDGTTSNAAIDPGTDNFIEDFVAKSAASDEGSNPVNDRLITITHREFWGAMQSTIAGAAFNDRMENLTEALAVCFAAYGLSNTNNNLPMPAPLNINGGEYRKNVDYDDSGVFTTAFAGRLPYDVDRANIEIPISNQTYIFNNTFCDNLSLPTAGINDIHFTDDNGSDKGEYFDLWQNWKDHFFYAISAHYKPGGAGSATLCGSDCVMVNGTKYAAIVFFSGLKRVGQQRYTRPFDAVLANKTVDPLNVDDKDDIANYLEGNNVVDFPDNTGNAVYDPVNGGASNDVMFCIQQDMSVVECL